MPQLDTSVPNMATQIAEITSQEFSSYYNEETKLTGEEFLMEMGKVCIDEFKVDLDSRAEWERNAATMLRLFNGFMENKTYPWPNCSNVNMPFITIAVLQFHARVYESLLPPKNIVQVDKSGQEDIRPALRVEKFMNWQIYNDIPHFETWMDKTLMQVPIVGMAFKKTFWNALTKKVESKYISSADFVVNYGAEILEEAPRKSHVLYLTKGDIRRRVKAGMFSKNAWNLPYGTYKSITELGTALSDAKDKISGVSDNRNLEDNTYTRTIIEQHREYDITGDGVPQPYIISVDYETEQVVRISLNSYVNDDGVEETAETFTDYGFLPNSEGFYWVGLGALLKGLNESANSILNEIIDSGGLANLQGGFIAKRGGIKKGDLTFKMGEWKEIEVFTDDIKKALYNFDFKGPNQTLYAVLGLLYEYSKLVSSVSETMTGAMPASDTPAQTVLALIEEGRKVFSSIHKRLHRSFKKELRKIFILDKFYLDETKYMAVIGEKTNLVEPGEQYGKIDFKTFYDIQPVSDPTIVSKGERIIKAKELKDDVVTNPLTSNDMHAIYVSTKRYYEAIDVPDIDDLLKGTQPQDVAPEDENAGFIKTKPANVLPKQDHQYHLMVHGKLETGPFADTLTPEGKDYLLQHKQDHWAEMYLQGTQAAQGMQSMQGVMNG